MAILIINRYGGIYERGSREYTLDDFYALQLDKMERYVCLKESGVVIGDAEESSSDDDEQDDEEGDDEEGDEDFNEERGDEGDNMEAVGAGRRANSHDSSDAEVDETVELIEKTQEEKVHTTVNSAKRL